MHPVDRLHAIRKAIASLRLEAAEIRRGILAGEISRKGDDYAARVKTQVAVHAREDTPDLFNFRDNIDANARMQGVAGNGRTGD